MSVQEEASDLAILPLVTSVPDRIVVDRSAIIAAAGFEDRTLALVSVIEPQDCILCLVTYKDWGKGNQDQKLLDSYVAKGIQTEDIDLLEYDRFDPDRFGDALAQWLELSGRQQIVVDISTMSRLAMMVVLDVCRGLEKSVSVFYAEAVDYGPSEQEYLGARQGAYPRPSIQVYSGLGEVVRSRRLSSVALQGEPTALIAFMSMNEVLTQALINCISPSRLFLINGRPPVHGWRELATAWIHEELRTEWPERDNPCEQQNDGVATPIRVTSTLDYIDTIRVLLDLYWSSATDFRVVLAPTGSKMQTLACYIVKGVHTDIHIEYPTPESFLPAYSTGIGSRWFINFGHFEAFLAALRTRIMSNKLMVVRAPIEDVDDSTSSVS